MYSAYIISKPLQYFNATNIADSNKKIALISNSFKNAEIFFQKVKNQSKYWDDVFFFDSNTSALQWLVLNKNIIIKVFIDGDYSYSKARILRRLKDKDIFVYEEGLGTYEPRLRLATTKNITKSFTFFTAAKVQFLAAIYNFLGMKDHHGGSQFTKGLYVYDIECHKNAVPKFKKKRLSFKNSFAAHLSTFQDKSIIYNENVSMMENVNNKEVVLYLSSWQIDIGVSKIVNKYEGCVKIAKPHPQIAKEDYAILYNMGFDYIVESENMVEFLIHDLLKSCLKLTIIHHNSAALRYFRNEKMLKEIVI